MTNLNEALLEDLLGRLESVRAWSPRVISRIATLIHTDRISAGFPITTESTPNTQTITLQMIDSITSVKQ